MGQILYINKPKGYTSFDVCHKLKRKFQTRRIGHTGTLDPNAEGVLIVMVDEACKILPYIHHTYKTYRASMKLGVKTDTADIWGKTIEEKTATMPSVAEIETVFKAFKGQQTQIPPMTSAVKVKGKKLYEYQRAGIEIEREARPIEVKELRLIKVDDEIHFEAIVSTGTYIRTLIEDIAQSLGQLATMTALVRTHIDTIGLEQCFSIEEVLDDKFKSYTIEEILAKYYPLINYPVIEDIKNGKRISLDCQEPVVMVSHNGQIIAAYELEHYPIYKCKRGLWV